MSKERVSEANKRTSGTVAVDEEYERLVSNWNQHNPKWKRLRNKKELNLNNMERRMRKHLWIAGAKELLDLVTEVSGEERALGCLPEV